MHITKLILHGYTRLLYADINHFEYTLTSPYQLILGTNGSGKSSVIAELSPLPASRQDYLVGGYKRVELTHEGKEYVLISEFKSGSKHTFICDGEVLNNAGTQTIQKELVKAHFNYTPELHDLMTGATLFTEMSPIARRDWISRICTTDVTWGLNLYQRLKSAARQSVEVRKHAETRLSVEYKGLLSAEELEALQVRLTSVADAVTQLMYHVDSQSLPMEDARRQYRDAEQELLSIARDQILRQNTDSLRGLSGQAVLEDSLRDINSQLDYTARRLADKRAEYTELEDTLQQLSQVGGLSGDHLQEELRTQRTRLQEYYSLELTFDFGEVDYRVMYNNALEIETRLTDALLALPKNPGRRFNRLAQEETKRKVEELVAMRNVKATELSRVSARLELIRSASKVECPSCRYIWIPGVSENEARTLGEKMDELESQFKSINEAFTRNSEFLEELVDWHGRVTNLQTLVKYNRILSPLWTELLKDDRLNEDPTSCVTLFYRWCEQLKQLSDRTDLEHRIDEIETVLKRASELANGGSTEILTNRAKGIEETIAALTQNDVQLRAQRERTQRDLTLAKQLSASTVTLMSTVERVRSTMWEYTRAIRNDVLNTEIHQKQSELAQLQHLLTEKKTARDIVGSLEATREEMTHKEQQYDYLLEALSPTTGIIADQLNGCITALVEQLNEFVGYVWTYDMVVLPCGQESGELDYKFPVEIKNHSRLVGDIAMMSKGQGDIINFAFVLVAMSFMDIKDIPLTVDELGATFDPAHRQRVVNFFKQLIESQRASQIFYISHNAEAHTTLTHAEICVMDAANIGNIAGANQHVIIE